ncbi:MAG: preprotein translocase, YajC subunit [Verrucomicrobiales bacterium]|jgi:preprotein translocase subunit YajC|nr:preprotein translocase, YajC subunit [Verrucomicrobiales bacterium]
MGPSPAGQTSTAPSWVNFVPLLLMVFVFYFVFIRPQQRKSKELQNLLGSLKSGDKVVTSSGIVGTVVSVKDRTVSLRSSDTKIEVLKSAISEITERGSSESSESKS